jgi:hypothetical protein
LKAVLDYEGKPYTLGYTVITRPDLDTFYYYQPAIQRISIVDVKVPANLKVGYIMGAGDDIATVLKQVGVDVTLIPTDRLAGEDLSRYGTIILGIRAYDTQKDVIANNKRLLDFTSAGGTLLVQYEAGVSDFNNGHFTPYPAQLSRARVSVEEAPVEILAPGDSVFHYPNQITQKDLAISNRCSRATIPAKPRRGAGCCERSMAREPISIPAMLFSGSCPRACRER